MKTLLFISLLFTVQLVNAESCSTSTDSTTVDKLEDVNTKVPKALEGATITITLKNGKTEVLKAEQYKVVKRVQQFKVVERTNATTKMCTRDVDGKKNLVMIGARRDHTGLSKSINGNVGTVSSERDLVLDAAYMREKVFKSNFGIGAGIDTNGTVRGILGLEF